MLINESEDDCYASSVIYGTGHRKGRFLSGKVVSRVEILLQFEWNEKCCRNVQQIDRQNEVCRVAAFEIEEMRRGRMLKKEVGNCARGI